MASNSLPPPPSYPPPPPPEGFDPAYYRPRGPHGSTQHQSSTSVHNYDRREDRTYFSKPRDPEPGKQKIWIFNLAVDANILTLELFKLVNIEDHNQIISVKIKLGVDGSFGEVYRGRYSVTGGEDFLRHGHVVAKKNRPSARNLSEKGRRVEVSGIRPTFNGNRDRFSLQQEKLRRRMVKEARVAEYLDHPAITHYFGLFVMNGDQTNELADFYLVSDYVNGGLAREYLSRHRTPANTEKLVSIFQSFRAL
jgi:hypothetical protein